LFTDFCRTFGISLDLALEAREIIRGETGEEIPGVQVEKEKYDYAEVTIVKIVEPYAEKLMGKPVGTYITIEAPVIRENNPPAHREITEVLARELTPFVKLPAYSNILVVGLGNWRATPDSLGPKVCSLTVVTRHLFNYAPQALKEGMRSVSTLAPGVLGITGIETAEIIKGVVEKIRPELLITVDALAARSVHRIGTTIQIADTGISPGSGIGNQRTGINKETMGVPVIAIGIPTVAHAAVIARDTLDQFFEQLRNSPDLYQIYKRLSPRFSEQVITQVLEPFGGNLTVTPKEIDALIHAGAKIVAGGITLALHPDLTPDEYSFYLH